LSSPDSVLMRRSFVRCSETCTLLLSSCCVAMPCCLGEECSTTGCCLYCFLPAFSFYQKSVAQLRTSR
jgi:hypothetical protein